MDEDVKQATPFDLFKTKSVGRVTLEVANERLAICKSCPEYRSWTGQCKLCGCFMKEKTKLPNAFCPMNPPKWGTALADSAAPQQGE